MPEIYLSGTQKPPKRLGVIAGDCIHNLRAALDNTVWTLGKIFPPTDQRANADKLALPICGTKEEYDGQLRRPSFKAITEFPNSLQSLIESLQSYHHQPEPHSLSILHALWNVDKHRSPDFMGYASRGVSVEGYNLEQPASLVCGSYIHDGAEFGYGTIPAQGISANAKITLISPEICFHQEGPAQGYVARELLLEFHSMVSGLVAKFEKAMEI